MRLKLPKLFLIIFLFTGLWSLVTINLHAQTTSALQKASDDYAFQYSKYVEADNSSQNALAIYNSFKTTTAKEDAFQKTQAKISQTDTLYIAYLRLTNEVGNNFDWQNQIGQKANVTKSLSDEMTFFQNNQQGLNGIQTLEQLPDFAKNLSDHIKNITNPLISKTQATYSITQAQVALDNLQTTANDLQVYATQKLQGTESATFFANWNSEIAAIIKNAQTQIDLAKQQANTNGVADSNLINITQNTKNTQDILNKAIPLFNEVANLK